MTIGLTWRRTARRIKRLKEGVLTISPDYSNRPTPDLFGALCDDPFSDIALANFATEQTRQIPLQHGSSHAGFFFSRFLYAGGSQRGSPPQR